MNAEEYIEHAEECERLAAIAKLETNKRVLLDVAKVSGKGEGGELGATLL
jgi:hypothetical protein